MANEGKLINSKNGFNFKLFDGSITNINDKGSFNLGFKLIDRDSSVLVFIDLNNIDSSLISDHFNFNVSEILEAEYLITQKQILCGPSGRCSTNRSSCSGVNISA